MSRARAASVSNAQRTTTGNVAMCAADGYLYVWTPNGEVYVRSLDSNWKTASPPSLVGNFWQGTERAPRPSETWGGVRPRTK